MEIISVEDITREEFLKAKAKKKPTWRNIINTFLNTNKEAVRIKIKKGSASGTVHYIKKLFPNLDIFQLTEGDVTYIYVSRKENERERV